jgi:predicted  nucleic acid-binding Zn-ribbon protein
LFESAQQDSAQLKQRLEEMMTKDKRQKIGTEAARIAAGLTKDSRKVTLLEEKLSQRLALVDDHVRVVDESGQLTVSTIEELTSRIKADYPFLIDGSQATGGGAARSSGGAGSGDKIITRADYDSMRPIERSKYMQAGGKVTD